MTKTGAVEAVAEAEMDDALALSATMGASNRAKFRQAIQDVLTLLESNPALGAKLPRTPYRQYPMVGYPYYIVYREETDCLRVLVFGKAYRRPNYWKKRLQNP